MLTGAHTIIYSTNPDADRRFFRDVLGLPNVDAGDGWLIFELPASELAVHPSEKNDVHQFFFICENIQAFSERMTSIGIHCSEVSDHDWGLLVEIILPGGGKLGVYEPKHARP